MKARFRPRFWPTLGAGLLIAVFCALADWQARRALAARDFQRRLEAAAHAPPRPWRAWRPRAADWRRWRYRPVVVHGTYDARHQVLLEEMYNQGRNGDDVLTPFKRRTGGWVLVDRGWIPRGFARRSPARLAPPRGTVTVKGLLARLPRPAVRLGGNPPSARWPARLLFPRRAGLERRLGRPLPAAIVLLGPHEPGGYVRRWTPRTRMGPWRHWGYAAQWLLLAVVVAVVWVGLNFKRDEKHG